MYPGELAPGVLSGFYKCPDGDHPIHNILLIGHPAELLIAAKFLAPNAQLTTEGEGKEMEEMAVVVKDDDGTYMTIRPAALASQFLANVAKNMAGDN